MTSQIRAGDRVVLRAPSGRRHTLVAEAGTARISGLGVVKAAELVGRDWGSIYKIGSEEFQLLKPTLGDFLGQVERGAQIVLPKDAARIVLECGLHAGSRVLEAGVGSGALTIVLAHAVAPGGRVTACDIRDDHLNQGRRNVAAAGLESVVDFRIHDVTTGLPASDLDAVVLDLPDPAAAVGHAWKALTNSGIFASYSPQVSQVEGTVRALRAEGFIEVRSLELLERGWVVGERGSRPETNMLGHTGFLTFGRRP